MKKSINILLNIAGILTLFIAICHILFWEAFDWNNSLACLNNDNRSIMYALNLILILNLLAMSGFTIFLKKELIISKIGTYINMWFFSIWFFRLLLEFILWSKSPNLAVIILCLLLGIIYLYIFFVNLKYKKELIF